MQTGNVLVQISGYYFSLFILPSAKERERWRWHPLPKGVGESGRWLQQNQKHWIFFLGFESDF